MKVTYDPSVDAAYIALVHIGPGDAKSTYKCHPKKIGGMLNLDFDANGRLIGIEVVGALKLLPPELLISAAPPLTGS